MSKKAKVKVILPDWHFGVTLDRVTARAQECALQVIEFLKPDEVIHLGDLLDCAAFSSHGKKSLKETEQESYLEDEVYPALEMLDRIQASCKKLHVLEGNHENRVERFLANNFSGALAREMFDLLSPRRLLAYTADGYKRKNFSMTPYAGNLPLYRINRRLYATHGFSVAKRAAEVTLDMMPAGISIVFGHVHRRVEATKRDPITGQLSYAWSPGCLTCLQPAYFSSPSNHSHGFSVVYESLANSGDFTHYQVAIVNGRAILPCGTEIKV